MIKDIIFDLSNQNNMNTNIHYKLTLNLITCTLTEEWTVDFGNGPIWEKDTFDFPNHCLTYYALQQRSAAFNMYRSKKCTDTRDQYTLIK